MNWNRTEAELQVELEQAYRRIAELESAAGGFDVAQRQQAEAARRESERRLRAMLEISQALSAPLELSAILQKIVESAVGLLALDSGAIYTLQGDALFLEATTPPLPPGFPDELRRAAVGDHPHVQAALASGATVILPDTTTAELAPAEKAVAAVRGLRSIAYFPLMIADRAIGVLIVASVNRLRTFDDEEIALYAGYSGQAAQTIENAWLYQAEREHAAELEAQVVERKQAEEILANTERRYRALIENAPDGIVLVGLDGRFKYASPSVTRLFGYTQDEALASNPNQLTHPEDLPTVLTEIAALIENPTYTPTVQYRFLHKNGEWRWIESTFSNLLTLPSVEGIVINFRDIHARKLAEEALNKSQARLTEAQRIGRIGHMEWNAGEQSLIFSDEVYAILGLPQDMVITQSTIAGMMAPAERARIQGLDMQSMQQRSDMNYEYVVRLQDGSDRWIHQLGGVTYAENGMPIRMMAIIQDVTERKQAEATLRDSRSRVEMALEGANAGMWDWNVQTGAAVFNERWAEMLGYTLKELEPVSIQTWFDLCHPDDLKVSAQLLQDHFAEKTEYYEYEARLRHKNGSWIWVIDRGKVMEWNAEGRPVRMFGTHLDITERKRAEDALRASEEKYRSLIKSLNNAISVVDIHGQLLYMNDMAAEGMGGSPQELIGRNLVDLFPEPFASPHLAAIQNVFQSDQETVYETPRMVEGGLRWFRVAFQPLHDETGQVVQVLVNATDIHDLKSAQDELQVLNRTLEERVAQRTAEVQDLYENAPTGYHSLDANGNFVIVNQTELNWLGYAREEMIGRAVQDFVTEESYGVFRAHFQLLLQRGWVKDAEIEFVRKDGSILPVSLSATTVRDEAGNFVMSRTTLFDITERKRAENELRRNVNFTSALLNSIPTPVFYKDKEGKYLGCNRAFAEVMGKTSAEIAGKLPHQIWPAEHADVYRQTDIDLLHSQEIQSYESTVNDKDGNIRPVIFVKSLFLDESGKTAGLVGAFIDIGERKKTENALREREEQNRLLFEESPVPIALLDETGHILHANRAHEQLTGIRRSDLYGKTPVEMGLVDAQVSNNLTNAMIEAMSRQENFAIVEHPLTSADGTRCSVESRIYLLPINAINHILVTTNDITTHKAAEETLRQANVELERAMRMKDEFLATMSHELRTPLTGILGLSEALQLQVYGGLNEKQMKAANNIENSGRHLLELINDILDLSKVEAGRLELQIARCSLEEICKASLHLTKGMAQQRRQHVHYAAPLDPILLDVDGRRIKQVLVNLLSNAIKFTPENGELGLIIEHDHTNRQVRLIVWDEGIGIKPENLSRLFQPFTQIDGSLAREYSGTGLGLALVRRLVELHNGSVAVESVFGEGSRFIVTLPWIAQTVQVDAPGGGDEESYVATVDENRSAPMIYIADDNHILLDLLADFLAAQKYRTVKAQSGKELLAKIESIKPAVILMDIQMPGMDGLETIHLVRNHPDAVIAATPIIALTALAMPGDRERCLAAGANEYMSKPLNLKNLVAVIRDLTPADRRD